MSKLNELVNEFAELNLKVVRGIQSRGFSHSGQDTVTLGVVRENILALKSLGLKLNEALTVTEQEAQQASASE